MKKYILLIFISIISMSLFGCASVKPITDAKKEISHVYQKNYDLGIKKTVYVGEEIIKVMDYYVVKKNLNKLRASNDFTVSIYGLGYHVNKGAEFNILGQIEENDGIQYLIMFPEMPGIRFCVNSNGTISNRLIGGMNQKFAESPNISPRDITLDFVTVEEIDKSKGYINFEMVFTGISEKNINVLYREYTNEGLARAAFYQNLTYPINSKIIRFKKILISVTNVTPEQIDYVIMQDGLFENDK